MRRVLLGLLAVGGGLGLAGETPHGIEATTGPPRVDVRQGSPARLYPRAEYERETAGEKRAVSAERDPWSHFADARYGLIGWEADDRVTFALRRAADESVFLIDSNRNGDLRDDGVLAAERTDHGLLLRFRLSDPDQPLALQLHEPKGRPPMLLVCADTFREGTLRIGETAIRFSVQGRFGEYGVEHQYVFFDTDGDGELDDTHGSDEGYVVGDEYVNLAGRSYGFAVDGDGGRITLEALDAKRPDRARLAAGNLAPDFEFIDIDGNMGRLSDYRGRVVLLYFWGTWCVPCRAETPHLLEAHERFHDDGLEILAVAKRDRPSAVLSYVAEHGIEWRQTIDTEEGPIVKLYRMDGVPDALLIDRDGVVAERSLRGAHIVQRLEALFPEATSPNPP